MIRTMALHTVNMNKIAACERWYWDKHGAQLYRRYEPWLTRFESFRAIALNDDMIRSACEQSGGRVNVTEIESANELTKRFGITNWMATSGYWREVPDIGAKGEMTLSSPPEHAYSYGITVPPQCTEDYKGSEWAPEEKTPIRWVQLLRWPEGVTKETGDDWYNNIFAPFVCKQAEVFRFFSFRSLEEDVRFPGEWKQESIKEMKGSPKDHHWDRMTEMWFDTFSDWLSFIKKEFPKPDWCAADKFPYLGEGDFVSGFLLERPAYNWKYENHTYL